MTQNDSPNPEQTTDQAEQTPATPLAESAPAEQHETATPAAPAPPAAPTATESPAPPAAPAAPAAPPAPAARPAPDAKPPDGHWWWGTGRRKAAVARVRIRPGEGKFIVNNKPHDVFFTEERDRRDLQNVLAKTNLQGALDVHVNVHGGGYTGQAGAIVLGLGRAINRYDHSLDHVLRENGFLTRDPRKVERKKYGQPGARKRFQFSKR